MLPLSGEGGLLVRAAVRDDVAAQFPRLPPLRGRWGGKRLLKRTHAARRVRVHVYA